MESTSEDDDAGRQIADPERLAWDVKVWEAVMQTDFRGRLWDRLVDRLIEYALPRIRSAINSGKIFLWCHTQNPMIKLHQPDVWLPEDQEELALGAVANAVRRFTEGARNGRGWSPDGGAVISSFLFRLCIAEFPNQFRTFLRDQQRHRAIELVEDKVPPVPGPDEAVATADEVRRALEKLAPAQRKAIVAKSNGFSHEEIAAELNVSPRAVEGLIYRGKQQLSSLGEADK